MESESKLLQLPQSCNGKDYFKQAQRMLTKMVEKVLKSKYRAGKRHAGKNSYICFVIPITTKM